MDPGPNDRLEKITSSTSVVDEEHQDVETTNTEDKSPRLPRWTKLETLILIDAKRIADSQGRRKKSRSISPLVTGKHEPKWDSVSSYCRLRGVNRGPVQCQKRWSNMVSDFKKIKTRESQVKEGESFWMMRNDLKREKKLPGHFDKDVYTVLNGKSDSAATCQQPAVMRINADGKEADTADENKKKDNYRIERKVVCNSSTHARPESLLDFIEHAQGKAFRGSDADVARESPRSNSPAPMPVSEKQCQKFHQVYFDRGPAQGTEPGLHFWTRSMFQEGLKRRRLSLDGCEDINLGHHLIKVLERNNHVLNAQLEAQRMNFQSDREQQKAHTDILSSALSKISDALSRIADKL